MTSGFYEVPPTHIIAEPKGQHRAVNHPIQNRLANIHPANQPKIANNLAAVGLDARSFDLSGTFHLEAYTN